MAIEIERKFLVTQNPLGLAKESVKIRQGYIVNERKQVIRVREKGENYFLLFTPHKPSALRLHVI